MGGSGGAVDLVGAIASLDRERSLAGTLAALGRLRRLAERTGDRLDRLLAECTGAWLVSRGRITKDQNREATTMTQVMTEYERSLHEWAREKYAKEREEERAVPPCCAVWPAGGSARTRASGWPICSGRRRTPSGYRGRRRR